MTTLAQLPNYCRGARVRMVLIDDDIEGIDEDIEAVLIEPLATLEEPEGTTVDELPLRAYERCEIDLKYYKEAAEGDPGYEPGITKLILATVASEEEGPPPETVIRYAKMRVFYDDGNPFHVGEYTRDDYPEYPVESPFPPELPSGFSLKRRYRAVAVNGVLVTASCEMLPPPALPT